MCLAVPAKIVSKEGDQAVADLHGNRVEISTALTPEVKLGDWVLIHAGFAIKALDCEEVEETFKVLEDLSYRTGEEGQTGETDRNGGMTDKNVCPTGANDRQECLSHRKEGGDATSSR